MTYEQCLKEIVDCFDYYYAYALKIGQALKFWDSQLGLATGTALLHSIRLAGGNPEWYKLTQMFCFEDDLWWQLTDARFEHLVEYPLGVFLREFLLRKIKQAIKTGRKAGLYYLDICYLLSRKVSEWALDGDGSLRDFHMRRFCALLEERARGGEGRAQTRPLPEPADVSLKRKKAFLRAEREKRRAIPSAPALCTLGDVFEQSCQMH